MHHVNCDSVSLFWMQIPFYFSNNNQSQRTDTKTRPASSVRRMFSGILLSPFFIICLFSLQEAAATLNWRHKTNRLQLETHRAAINLAIKGGQGVQRAGGRTGEERTCVLPTLAQLFFFLEKKNGL